jgi:hypothetical protein
VTSFAQGIFALIVVIEFNACTLAGTIFETGTIGPTGITRNELLSQQVPGTNVSNEVFVAARFTLLRPALTTRVGGHFVGGFSTNSLFGAIVHLEDESDVPDSDDLSSSDVIGTTVLTFPDPSDEIFGDLSVRLEPGLYAVIFGSDLFGTDGVGAAVRNGIDHGTQSYFAWQPGSSSWHELDSFFANHRFVVEGSIIPEPTTATLIGFLLLSQLSRRRPRQSRRINGSFLLILCQRKGWKLRRLIRRTLLATNVEKVTCHQI